MAKKKRRGRNLKAGERHPCGKRVQPTIVDREEAVLSVAINNPDRRPFGELARSQYVGTALGRLRLSQQISVSQYDVIERAGRVIGRWLLSIPSLPVTSRNMLARYAKDDFGVEYAPQDVQDGPIFSQDDADERAKFHYDNMVLGLADFGVMPLMGLITKVEVRNFDLNEREIGDLRLVANALERIWSRKKVAA